MWLWARGYEGGGPYLELLRRLAHWLMKEPELEEEALRASARGHDTDHRAPEPEGRRRRCQRNRADGRDIRASLKPPSRAFRARPSTVDSVSASIASATASTRRWSMSAPTIRSNSGKWSRRWRSCARSPRRPGGPCGRLSDGAGRYQRAARDRHASLAELWRGRLYRRQADGGERRRRRRFDTARRGAGGARRAARRAGSRLAAGRFGRFALTAPRGFVTATARLHKAQPMGYGLARRARARGGQR